MMDSVEDIWSGVLDILKGQLSPVAINTWFSDCRVLRVDETRMTLCVPSDFRRGVIATRFVVSIKEALREIFACDMEVELVGEADVPQSPAQVRPSPMELEEFTFDTFVVGPSNKFAHAASIAVAEEQTKMFNPLFIYGDSGLGKTHLLYAIRHEVTKKHPEYKIVFVRGGDFMNELIISIQTGKNVEFREKYRSADLFMIDDIQIVSGKVSTQDEMFHTFNTLYEAHKQMVFTSDRPPSEMPTLADRLHTRFESGLLVDIQPPDFETRAAIIRNKAMNLGLILSDDVVNYIAENMTSNVRQIEGAVKKIRAYRDLMDTNITVSVVAKLIKDMFRDNGAFIPTHDDIIEETAKYFNLSPEDVRGQRRNKSTSLARQIAMYEIRTLTNLSLKDIGDIFGGRDHTTVLSSIQKVEKAIDSDLEFAQMIKDITANINSRK